MNFHFITFKHVVVEFGWMWKQIIQRANHLWIFRRLRDTSGARDVLVCVCVFTSFPYRETLSAAKTVAVCVYWPHSLFGKHSLLQSLLSYLASIKKRSSWMKENNSWALEDAPMKTKVEISPLMEARWGQPSRYYPVKSQFPRMKGNDSWALEVIPMKTKVEVSPLMEARWRPSRYSRNFTINHNSDKSPDIQVTRKNVEDSQVTRIVEEFIERELPLLNSGVVIVSLINGTVWNIVMLS